MVTKKRIRTKTIKELKNNGSYNENYTVILDVFVDMVYQYKMLTDQLESEELEVTTEHTNKFGATNTIKKPIIQTIEKLRTDIATYTSLLGLNYKASLGTSEKPKSKFEKLLENL